MKKVIKYIFITLALPFLFLFLYILVLKKKPVKLKGEIKENNKWHKKRIEGVKCSLGAKYYAFAKKGKEKDKLVVSFSGGGAAFSKKTATKPNSLIKMLYGRSGYYFANCSSLFQLLMNGLLAENDIQNPFNDWNYIYLPYASADFHTGRNKLACGRKKVNLTGYYNIGTALKTLIPYFNKEGIKQILIKGDSAGAFGCVAWTEDIIKMFPSLEKIVVYSEGSQLHSPIWRDVAKDIWNAEEKQWSCLGEEGKLIVDWMKRADAVTNQKVVWLHSNSTYDRVLSQYQNAMNFGELDLTRESMDNYHKYLVEDTKELLNSGINYHCFICDYEMDAKGSTVHTFFRSKKLLYETKINGITLAEWLTDCVCNEKLYNIGVELLD